MAGEIPYTDPRVKKVYIAWKTLIDNHYFIDNALSYDLDSIAPFLTNGKAAMDADGHVLLGEHSACRQAADKLLSASRSSTPACRLPKMVR